ncbi:MAG TPA: 50S ribosomal protein L13 [Candidatus Nanoarchaeia archaeon]|nr:50S ribosomal protein L13 [Candidatus Nanoarchaeia archaeon]
MDNRIIIDGKDAILGRVCTYAAKQALLGQNVQVINCEEMVVSGKKNPIIENYTRRIDRKAPNKGPYLYRRPDMFVRRTIRGMLPFKRSRGREAYKNVICHVGVPPELKDSKAVVFEDTKMEKLKTADTLKLKEICGRIGAR